MPKNRPPIKWQEPGAKHRRNQQAVVKMMAQAPICHCEEAKGRRGALSAKREEVPSGCNLGEALPICTGHRENGMHQLRL